MSEIVFSVADVNAVFNEAEEAGFIDEDTRAKLSGLLIARAMIIEKKPLDSNRTQPEPWA